MSCEMIFGQEPPSSTDDPALKQPCYKLCKILILRILLTFIYMPIILMTSKFSKLSKMEEKKNVTLDYYCTS